MPEGDKRKVYSFDNGTNSTVASKLTEINQLSRGGFCILTNIFKGQVSLERANSSNEGEKMKQKIRVAERFIFVRDMFHNFSKMWILLPVNNALNNHTFIDLAYKSSLVSFLGIFVMSLHFRSTAIFSMRNTSLSKDTH